MVETELPCGPKIIKWLVAHLWSNMARLGRSEGRKKTQKIQKNSSKRNHEDGTSKDRSGRLDQPSRQRPFKIPNYLPGYQASSILFGWKRCSYLKTNLTYRDVSSGSTHRDGPKVYYIRYPGIDGHVFRQGLLLQRADLMARGPVIAVWSKMSQLSSATHYRLLLTLPIPTWAWQSYRTAQ